MDADIHEIIELAWRDEVTFAQIEAQTGIAEKQVIKLMRANLKPSSFRMWRKRVTSGNARKSLKPQIRDDGDRAL
jgi:uncharacterized protein (TIGR03643 family)